MFDNIDWGIAGIIVTLIVGFIPCFIGGKKYIQKTVIKSKDGNISISNSDFSAQKETNIIGDSEDKEV